MRLRAVAMRLHYEFTADVRSTWMEINSRGKKMYTHTHTHTKFSSINLQKCQDPFLLDSILNDVWVSFF